MKRIVYALGIALMISSCAENASEKTAVTEKMDSSTVAAPATTGSTPGGCYQMIIKKDTARISFTAGGSHPAGTLFYHWQEKDRNDGLFEGQMLNDSTLLAHYTFNSEGMKSVRELVFRIKDSIILQGYGEEYQRHDTAFLRDPKLVVFDTKNPFVRGCD